MSLERMCEKCGAEYDCRHGSQCPACGSLAAPAGSASAKVYHKTIDDAWMDGWRDPYRGMYGRIYGKKPGNHRIWR